MNNFIRLTCPACGGKLELSSSIEQFACAHCGTEHVVNRSGGIISLQPLTEGLQRIQKGTDRTAAELALQRLRAERAEWQTNLNAVREYTEITTANLIKVASLLEQAEKSARTAMLICPISLVGSVISGLLATNSYPVSTPLLVIAIILFTISLWNLTEIFLPLGGKVSIQKLRQNKAQMEQGLSASRTQLPALEAQMRQIDQEIEIFRAQVTSR